MGKKYEEYEKLEISNDFMFYKVMQDENLCKGLLERIFGKKIKRIEYQTQKAIEITTDSKGIRLDVYVDDEEGSVYDLEMQVKSYDWMPKRTRYYQSLIDLNSLEKGMHYSELNNSYVIFICNFDFFERNRYIYSFENICREEDLRLNDGAYKVILNTKGSVGEITPELKAVLDYFDGKEPTDDYTKELDKMVKVGRMNKEWQVEYMQAWMYELEQQKIGKEEGLIEGRAEGIIEGRAEGIIEGRAEGRAEGIIEGRAEGIIEGRAEGRAEGIIEGRAEGRAKGIIEGRAEGRAEGIAEGETNILKKMLKRGYSQESLLELGYSLEDIRHVKAQM